MLTSYLISFMVLNVYIGQLHKYFSALGFASCDMGNMTIILDLETSLPNWHFLYHPRPPSRGCLTQISSGGYVFNILVYLSQKRGLVCLTPCQARVKPCRPVLPHKSSSFENVSKRYALLYPQMG